MLDGKKKDLRIRDPEGMLMQGEQMYVPNIEELKRDILDEAHISAYAMHPRSTKMYHTIQHFYYWPVCQQVKAERKKSFGLLQPLTIPQWKWEDITMDFMYKLPRTRNGYDGIWVIVDRLTKSAHFVPVRENYSLSHLAEQFISEVVKYYGVLVVFQEALGSRLLYSTAYHPQTDGQSERTIQTLEDMLRSSVLQFGDVWHKHLLLIEFAYNNNFHSSIGMTPFKALYRKPCRTALCWSEVIKANLKAAQDRYNSIADRHSTNKVVANRLALPPELARVHNVFHVSMLRMYVSNPSHVIPSQPLEINLNLTYDEVPMTILDLNDKVLRNKTVQMVKVLWRNHSIEEATWETKKRIQDMYPRMFYGFDL
ncbi:unnamed protein product [Malus baccata var. baccata]